MKQLNSLQNAIFVSGAVLMVAGAALWMMFKSLAPWIFAVGALAFVAMQVQQRYEGDNFTIQRLRRIMLMSDVLLILTAALMFADDGNPFGLDHLTWLNYIHNNWMVLLLLAAVIQLYTVFRMDSELKKEAKKR
ncbi:MAG: hypothetical protein J6V97_00770 [Prevotella sp.]|jgi:hypothetical protein|nr:hypothetical protein [Prevotella sp.]